MIPYNEMEHNPLSEKIVQALMQKNPRLHDPLVYRVMTGFYLAKAASMMRIGVEKYDRQTVPVNLYALTVMPSGLGKGLATNLIETNIMGEFRTSFLENTFPLKAEERVRAMAREKAIKNGTDEGEELEQAVKEFMSLGPLMFAFDSGTVPALKQMRTKLLIAGAGSMNFHIDEIGNNLIKNQEMLETFLEIYDVGKVKQKLIKNTAENQRLDDMEGITPGNLLMFGAPAALLDGGKVEELFREFLLTGYARRCFYAIVDPRDGAGKSELSPEEIYENLLNSTTDEDLSDLSTHFESLTNPALFGKVYRMSRTVAIEQIAYMQHCADRADTFPAHDEVGKAEMLHRFFKMIKLAGAYAFSDQTDQITMEQLYAAIKLTEESGEAFKRIVNRDKNYVRLARFICESGTELTQADLVESLPFYKGTAAIKNDMLNLATSWAHKHNMVIQKKFSEGIEFIYGDALVETNLDEMILSHSNHDAYNYTPEVAPFNRLHELTQLPAHHWCNHHLRNGHREEGKCIKGFNTIVLDVDHGCTIETAQLLLKGYRYLLYTTKRHTSEAPRFRIILPLSHVVKLSDEDFVEFMKNVFEWLPFSDEQTAQRSRKWACHNGSYIYGEGELVDALPFIPATTKSEAHNTTMKELGHLDQLERWFALRMVEGQRSNEMVRFALMLVDSGMPLDQVEDRVSVLNNKLVNPLEEAELATTVLKTAAKRFVSRGTN